MVSKDIHNGVIEFLKKHTQVNTFRLASELGIDRYKILNIIKKLEGKKAVEFRSGIVKFLKVPIKEKIIVRKLVKKIHFAPKKKHEVNKAIRKRMFHKKSVKDILENKLKIQTGHIAKLEKTIEELQQKINIAPRVIRKTIIKKVPMKSEERLVVLEKTLRELQRKVSTAPKIIKRTIIKNIIQKIPVKIKIKKLRKETKFKMPKLGIMKNIQKLKAPQFMKQKIIMERPKINFAKLNKSIQGLHVPNIIKKGG